MATSGCFELGEFRTAQRFPSLDGIRSLIWPGRLRFPSFDGFCLVVSRPVSGFALLGVVNCAVSDWGLSQISTCGWDLGAVRRPGAGISARGRNLGAVWRV